MRVRRKEGGREGVERWEEEGGGGSIHTYLRK